MFRPLRNTSNSEPTAFMFHSKNGLFFKLNWDNSVTIVKTDDGRHPSASNVMCNETLQSNEWESVVASTGGGLSGAAVKELVASNKGLSSQWAGIALENGNLRAQLAACQSREAKAKEELKHEKLLTVALGALAKDNDNDRIFFRDKAKQAEADRDQLQAQVGELRGALEGIKEPAKEALRLMRREGWEHIQKPETDAAFRNLFDAWSNLSAALAQPAPASTIQCGECDKPGAHSHPAPAAPDSAKDGGSDDYGPNAPFNSVDCRP